MLADTDAGNVVTAAQAGAQWGYRLLPLVLVLIPMLYMVQELTVRLGLYTGRGHGELIRERFGLGWAFFNPRVGGGRHWSLVTEFTGVAGIGELFGLSRALTLPLAAATLLFIVASGSYKRVERVALIIGLFELAFFVVAWRRTRALRRWRGTRWISRSAIATSCFWSRPHRRDVQPVDDLFQQSATVDKRLHPATLSMRDGIPASGRS